MRTPVHYYPQVSINTSMEAFAILLCARARARVCVCVCVCVWAICSLGESTRQWNVRYRNGSMFL
jgi:uncharacterized protein HemY